MKKIVMLVVLCCLVATLAGCLREKTVSHKVSGEILGDAVGKIVVGDTIASIQGQSYTAQVSSGIHILKVLDLDGTVLYQEELAVAQDVIRDIDLCLLNLTEEQAAEVKMKKAQTEELRMNWNQRKEEVKKTLKEEASVQVAGCIGSYGDILVTLDGLSIGSLAWAGGHAGLVEDSNTVIECFGNKGNLNGVRRWPNDWAIRYDGVNGLRVNGATLAKYQAAKAEGGKHVGKPYNYNFFYITTTNSFYCSQLVWRAWYNQGFDLNDGGAVWPVDLIESSLTYSFYIQ